MKFNIIPYYSFVSLERRLAWSFDEPHSSLAERERQVSGDPEPGDAGSGQEAASGTYVRVGKIGKINAP